MQNFKKLFGGLLLTLGMVLLPKSTLAITNIDEILKDGKLVVPSIKPTTFEENYNFIGNYIMEMDNVLDAYPTNCNEDFSVCDIDIDYLDTTSETKNSVTIEYIGGSNTIKEKIDLFKANIPSLKTFAVNDLEVVNYLVNGAGEMTLEEKRDILASYSGELKKILNNSNITISFKTATGMGDVGELFEAHLGDAVLGYDGINYSYVGPVGAKVKYVIYVEDGTTDLLKRAQERIDEYIGKGKVKLEVGGEISTLYQTTQDMDFDFSEDGLNIDSSLVTNYYNIVVGNLTRPIIIIADSSKMVEPSYASTDLETDIRVSSENKNIPLDARVKATKVTEGEEYDKIIKLLDVDDNETYDLSLFSLTLNNYIKKLDNGKFLVTIPLKEELRDKNLVVYFVKEDNTIEEHEVKYDEEKKFIQFETDHFSIYTLAEKQVVTSNPKTFDSVVIDIIILSVSVVGLIGISCIYLKKRKNSKISNYKKQ